MYKNGFDYESKALDYYWKLLQENNYDPRNLKELLEDGNVGSSILSDTWWEDSNFTFSGIFLSHFKTKEVFDMFDFYKPPTHLTEQEIQEQCCNGDFYTYGNYAPRCQNTKCENYRNDNNDWCSYSDWADACIVDTVYNILFAFEIGGWSAIDELRPQFDKRVINRICETLPQKYIGKREKELYQDNLPIDKVIKLYKYKILGSDKMSKPFWDALSDLKGELSVFWTYGTMYINGEDDTQASTSGVTLFQAYRFASLIKTSCFDYDASDEAIKEFQAQLLEFYQEVFSEDEQKKYIIDVWEYLDDIADDYKKLTGVTINDIDYKRAIVSYMSETDWENNCAMGFGSGTYIARLISDHIVGDERNNVARCNNPLAIELANKYLQTDNYDVVKFAEELHKECEYKMDIPKNFNEYLLKAHTISEKCYYLLGRLLQNNREYTNDILVGYIDWFGDYEENERYIYCHIDSIKNEIYFYENREHPCKSAYLHDIAFPHLIGDPSRIQEDIVIKFTEQYIDDVVKNKMYDIYGIDSNDDPYFGNEWGYNYCHMYGTVGGYAL